MECTSETRFDIYQMTNRTHLTIIIGPNLELFYNDFIVNVYIQLYWEQAFTTYQSLSIQIYK